MERLLFVDEVAERLRRSPASIRWMVANKTIPHGRLGGRVVFKESEIQKFIDDAFAGAR